MSDTAEYTPPKVWVWNKPSGGRFANINRPVSGPTHDKELPVGRHPLQLYSQGTPNGVKVTVMLEELLAAGHKGAEYDAWLIRIGEGDQFGSGFVAINPNSKIPALVDRSGPTPIRVFEIGRDPDASRREVRRVSADRAGGARGMPVMAVLADGQHALCRRRFRAFLRLCAGQDRISRSTASRWRRSACSTCSTSSLPTINTSPAANTRSPTWRCWPWYGGLVKFGQYGATEFLKVQEYKNVQRWADMIYERPAVKRGRMVNRTAGDPSSQLHERHDAGDFETRTQDKLAAAQ